MKKVIQQEQYAPLVAKYYCDKHPKKECFSRLEMSSWYGSQFDMDHLEVHLCDECVQEMYNIVEKMFGIKPKMIEL